jgi:IS30 family transposase
MNLNAYFTRLRICQDKGTIENKIGQLGSLVTKKNDFNKVANIQVKHVERLLKNRPLRKYNYKTPNQIL